MSRLLNKNMFYTAITRAKKKCIIIADDVGLLECKKEMPKRITNLYRTTKSTINKSINDHSIIDDMIAVTNNLDKYLKSDEICKLLTDNGINISRLNNANILRLTNAKSNNCNNELGRFYKLILLNDELLKKLFKYNDDKQLNVKKINTKKIIDV